MDALKRLLEDRRLVTVVGAGGAGKTRLAIEAARELAAFMTDGAAFADLSCVTESEHVSECVASCLGLVNLTPKELEARVGEARLLLVIDNAEHVVGDVALVVDRLLATCANVRVLVTSRRPLEIGAETSWRLPALPLPPDRIAEPGELLAYDCAQLFCVRAGEMGAEVNLSAATAPLVAAVCRQLDGIPLALELAAARVASLGLDEIAGRLRESLRLLRWERRDVAARHATMRAAIAWSYDLLGERERRLFDRLSIFAGDFDLQAARTVCTGDDLTDEDLTDALHGLVRSSLVTPVPQPEGRLRYRILEVLRQFGAEMLPVKEAQELARCHAAHYGQVVADIRAATAADRRPQFRRLDAEYPNVRQAMEWAARLSPELEARLTRDLGVYWAFKGSVREGRERVRSVLAKALVPADQRVRLGVEACRLALMADDVDAAAAVIEEVASILDQVVDGDLAMCTQHLRGLVAMSQDDLSRAERYLNAAVRMMESAPATPHGVWALNSLAALLLQTERIEEARTTTLRALALNQAVGDEPVVRAEVQYRLGTVELRAARPNEAYAAFTRALTCAVEYELTYLAADYIRGLAVASHGLGDAEHCLELLGAAARCAAAGVRDGALRQRAFVLPTAAAEGESRAKLGARAADEVWSRGTRLELSRALDLARERAERQTVTPAAASPPAKDTLRRARLRHSWTQEEVARQLGTRKVTVSRWERGTQLPSLYFQRKICSLFRMSAQDLGLASSYGDS